MSGAYLEALAHIALGCALVMGIAVGWAFEGVIEFYHRRKRA